MGKQNKKPQQVNNPHDTRQKELFSNKDAFISLLKDCVKAEWINDLDKESLRKCDASFILPDFKKKEADIVYEATINNHVFVKIKKVQKKNNISRKMVHS